MDNKIHNAIVSFIWGIADDCLRDVYVRGKYRDVILPMTVIRRLDAMLEGSKATVQPAETRVDNTTTPKTYTVKKGDCLWNIAKSLYGSGADYTKIYEANKGTVGSNPNLIYPGQVLTIPE